MQEKDTPVLRDAVFRVGEKLVDDLRESERERGRARERK
jgi:hypothetical protein